MDLNQWAETLLPHELDNLKVGPIGQRTLTVLLRQPIVELACEMELRRGHERMSKLFCIISSWVCF